MKKTVFLPIETHVREYNYKLTLGAKLAKLGYRVVLGQAEYLDKVYKYFPAGVYVGKNVFKTLFPTSLELYKNYKNSGWTLVHLDEEGGIFAGREHEWKQELNGRLDPNVLADDDKICCWGEFQQEYYISQLDKDKKVNIINTGQPKFHYKDHAYSATLDLDIKGKFILFNMNYSGFNNQLGIGYFLETNDTYRSNEQENYDYKRGVWLDQLSNFGSILNVINKILNDNEFNEYTVVVRPHPAENLDIYKSFFKDNQRVLVTNSDTAVEWSRKSVCTIHDGCTTAVEAFLSGCKVINYRNKQAHESVTNIIPNSVGSFAVDFTELKNKILINEKCHILKNEELCQKMIRNFDSNVDSFTMLVNEVSDSLTTKKEGDFSPFIYFKDLQMKVRSWMIYYPRKLIKEREANYIRGKRKFSGFERNDVETKLNKLSNVTGKQLKLVKYNENSIIIE